MLYAKHGTGMRDEYHPGWVQCCMLSSTGMRGLLCVANPGLTLTQIQLKDKRFFSSKGLLHLENSL